jgi:hypothetical protein
MRPQAVCVSSGETHRLIVHCVTRVNNTRYAVGSKPGVCLDKWPDSPPAGWNETFFFRKMWHVVPHFPEKEKRSTMLPQAKQVFIGSNARFDEPPRNCCKSQELRGH